MYNNKMYNMEQEKLENAHIQEVTSMELPLDWDNVFDTDERTSGVHTDSIPDALVMSLTTLGCVDIEYIASVTGEDYKTVINTLKGSIFQNPDTWGECFFKGWETAEEYLSGNLRRKLETAVKANKEYKGFFNDNIIAIKRVLPPLVASKDIYVTLGSPWVPTYVIDDFMEHLFGTQTRYRSSSRKYLNYLLSTTYDELTGMWVIPYKDRYDNNAMVWSTYGTKELHALDIIERTLNMKAVSITKEVRDPKSKTGKKRVLDKEETLIALEKQKLIVKEFHDWVWTDPDRKKKLEEIFENKFSCVRRRLFNGAFLNFPNMSPKVELLPYQKDAVARIIFTPNTLLAHDVGAGKTYVMIAAGQELKRMGLSTKNLYVVPNNIVGQWMEIFALMYPDAKVLCVDPASFKPEKREAVLNDIKDNDYDGIIMAYSCFEQIPLSQEYYANELREKIKKLETAIADKSKTGAEIRHNHKTINRLKADLERVKKELGKLAVTPENKKVKVFFDELGITRLFVDEAHNFKNVPITTNVKVLGINRGGSKKCEEMLDKVRMVQRNNNGKGVVFATGTPITNSVTDVFVMQQYLQSGELSLLDLDKFDNWLGMFAEKTTEFEVHVDTNSYRLATRFSKFHNLPELTSLLANIADFHSMEGMKDIPEINGYTDTLIEKTPELDDFLKSITKRADAIRNGEVGRDVDNMLMLTTDGRKAALDLRLVDEKASFSIQSKVAKCAENVADLYFKTSADKSSQLIFCDTSTPKEGFNIYDELKRLLVLKNVPAEAIAYIHDATTDPKRTALFKKVCKGDIRVLIGSTFKLGLGVNVQERLIALHHIDIPWRPADMTQREGRILRQGNLNKHVFIYRYITEGSFDAYSWQLLETKQRFISSLLSGSLTERSGSDIENTVLSYAEVKALAVGNPLVKERVEAANELSRYKGLQQKLVESRLTMEKDLMEFPGLIRNQQDLIENCEQDIIFYEEWKAVHPLPDIEQERAAERNRRERLGTQLLEAIQDNELSLKERTLFSYQGFDVVLPANMKKDKPYVWIKKNGAYPVELGESAMGAMTRINNCLEGLEKTREKYVEKLDDLYKHEQSIKDELAKDESYVDLIEMYEMKVAELDELLGVNEDE